MHSVPTLLMAQPVQPPGGPPAAAAAAAAAAAIVAGVSPHQATAETLASLANAQNSPHSTLSMHSPALLAQMSHFLLSLREHHKLRQVATLDAESVSPVSPGNGSPYDLSARVSSSTNGNEDKNNNDSSHPHHQRQINNDQPLDLSLDSKRKEDENRNHLIGVHQVNPNVIRGGRNHIESQRNMGMLNNDEDEDEDIDVEADNNESEVNREYSSRLNNNATPSISSTTHLPKGYYTQAVSTADKSIITTSNGMTSASSQAHRNASSGHLPRPLLMVAKSNGNVHSNQVNANAINSTSTRAVSYTHLTLPTNREV